MSIPNLPVNFKDDILASSNTKRKYQQTFNSDGSMSLEDVTQYTQKGSEFGASQVNQTNGAVNNIYDERIVDVEDLSLVTEPGFFVDALAIKEINADLEESKNNSGIINSSASAGKKTTTTTSWGAVIHSIILPEAGTYLVGVDYSGTNICFVSPGGNNMYLMPGGVALVTTNASTTIEFKSATGSQATWTEFLPFYVRLT